MLKNIGQRIRQIRKEKKLTLVDISKKTGVAQATLSRIETGSMIGTVESHQKIADILGVPLSELYSGADSRYEKTHHQKQDEPRKVAHHSKNFQIEVLTQESSKKKITPLLVTLQPEAEMSQEKSEHGVEKFIYVLEGEVKIKIEKEEYSLKAGETLYFDASFPHQISNLRPRVSKLLLAVSPSKL